MQAFRKLGATVFWFQWVEETKEIRSLMLGCLDLLFAEAGCLVLVGPWSMEMWTSCLFLSYVLEQWKMAADNWKEWLYTVEVPGEVLEGYGGGISWLILFQLADWMWLKVPVGHCFCFVRLPFSLIIELNFGLCPIFIVRFQMIKLNSLLSGLGAMPHSCKIWS
mgnify:CR=1 FL=1